MLKTFKMLDKNKDGTLSKEELSEGYYYFLLINTLKGLSQL